MSHIRYYPEGGQGDGIDVKGGITNLIVADNEIYDINGSECRALVTQGQESGGSPLNAVYERNYIHDCDMSYEAISCSDSWGICFGITFRNNIIDTVAAAGLRIYSGSGSYDIFIYNNTFYNCGSFGINGQSGTTYSVKNNAFLSNNSDGQQVSLSGTPTVANNAYSGSWNGGGTGNVSGLAAADFGDPANGDFTVAAGSKLIDVALDLSATGFSDDYTGATRTGTWDIGAYERGASAGSVTVFPDTLVGWAAQHAPTISAGSGEAANIAFGQSVRMRY